MIGQCCSCHYRSTVAVYCYPYLPQSYATQVFEPLAVICQNFCRRICIYTSTADLLLCRSAAFMQVSCDCPRPCLDRMKSNITWWWLILSTVDGIAELSEGHNCQPSSHYSHKIRGPEATFLSLNEGAISNLWNNISNPDAWSSCKDKEVVLSEWAVFSYKTAWIRLLPSRNVGFHSTHKHTAQFPSLRCEVNQWSTLP